MKKNTSTSRRNFLKSSVAIPAAAVAIPATASAGEDKQDTSTPLPTRQLGKNGPMVSMLNIGGMMNAHSPQYLDLAWNMGIRYFDTADCYMKGESERNVAKWVKRYPERRKDLFLVTKDHPRKGPEELLTMIDKRLANCGVDYIDLLFIHGIGTRQYGDESLEWPKSERLKKVFDELKASGKVKYCGFSCHDKKLIEYLNAAAEGGFCDAIMLKYNPLMQPGDDLDRALDACHKAGIGLISMKEMQPFAEAPKTHPNLEGTGISTQQTVLQSVWSDTRIASICSSMKNVEQLEENVAACQSYTKPIEQQIRDTLGEIAHMSKVPMCPGCPSCDSWSHRTDYAFQDISRYVTYYERDGRTEAREFFGKLGDSERTHAGLNLAQMRDECQFKVDYPEIARRSEQYFA
jgi:aryl-alcohol dehydrogenase-like predicted oxidoreductase